MGWAIFLFFYLKIAHVLKIAQVVFAKIDLQHELFLAMSRQTHSNQSNRGKTPFCAFCKAEGHWMKNYEEIICPKLKEKKQKQKLNREAAKTEKVWNTPTEKKEIKTTNNFDIFKQMMDQEEQAEEAKEQKQQDEEAAKQLKRDTKKAHKKGKKGKKTEEVYYDMPDNLK